MATKGRPKGSKNKVNTGFPITTKDMSKMTKIAVDQARDKELDKLKNLVSRQDDQIIQMCDEINQLKKEVAELGEEIDLFVTRVANYRQIIATLIEVTE